MTKIAFLFPGQGSQFPGMGKELYESFPEARDIFHLADDILGFSLTKLIFEGKKEELKKTENTQPAIFTVSCAALAVLKKMGILPQAAAGLSLGEYSALVCSNSLSFAETLPLVRSRGKYMQEAYPEGKGGMAAILGLEKKDVEEICVRSSRVGFVEPANYNCPGQVVISGDKLGLKEACRIVRQEMGKHAVMLSVSAPFHCSLLKSIEGKMRDLLEGVIIKKASIPVVSNVSADYVTTPNEIKDALIKQVSHPVLWEDSMCKLLREGHDFFLEVGPGKVLSGFMKRISSSIKILQMDNFQEVAAFFGK